ncbi:hypothetical protein [Marinobacter nauticus]|uniref:hypothetical protein n=1 Tax=Marinobacter nauticus TaxID=2743 RepID=UPI001C996B3F|nr:hypothetical protein [Marinobacter nauticus]MBY5963762.1 hypothetical protein [Marinobacter nauticus]
MVLPEQQYFTLAELTERWNTTEPRILELILNTELKAVALVSAMATATWSDEDKNAHETTTTFQLEVRTWFVPELLFSLFKEGSGELAWYVEDGKWFTFAQPVKISKNELLITGKELQRFEQANAVTETPDAPEPQPEIGTTERKTLLRMILGMAIRKYGYDPKAERNEATGTNNRSIAYDLERAGLTVDKKTIKKYLDAAAEELMTPGR